MGRNKTIWSWTHLDSLSRARCAGLIGLRAESTEVDPTLDNSTPGSTEPTLFRADPMRNLVIPRGTWEFWGGISKKSLIPSGSMGIGPLPLGSTRLGSNRLGRLGSAKKSRPGTQGSRPAYFGSFLVYTIPYGFSPSKNLPTDAY
jgi:hypothetical protein